MRIHESGDFYNQEYLDKWIQIANSVNDKKFLAFTKSHMLTFNNIPDNMTVMYSIYPDTYKRLSGLRKFYTVYKEEVVKNALKCPSECHSCLYCWNGKKDVYTEIH